MASPQLENGYTKIANELLDVIARIKLSGEEHQTFWTIIRKTYGFNKKMDGISLSQFSLATGILKPNVCRALSNLIKKNMIIRIDKGKYSYYRIQKDYTIWKPLSKLIRLSNPIMNIIKSDNRSLSDPINIQKKYNTKETITKEKERFEKEFEQLYKDYHPDGKKNHDYAKKRFMALCKSGKLEEFKKGYYGYAQFLKDKRINENFEQKPKYFSTLISDYKEYMGYKYKARL